MPEGSLAEPLCLGIPGPGNIKEKFRCWSEKAKRDVSVEKFGGGGGGGGRGVFSCTDRYVAEIIFVADPILNGKPMKLCKNGSDMSSFFLSFFLFSSFVCVYSSLKLLQQHFALPASRRLICFWGSPGRRLLQEPSFDKIRQTAMLLAALQVMYGRTLLGDLM